MDSDRFTNIADPIREGASEHGEKTALIFQDGRSLTYAQLDERTSRAANMLAAAGLRPGDRAALVARNGLQYVELLFGAAKAGVVLALINWRLSPSEIAVILDDCNPALILLDASLPVPSGDRPVILFDDGDADCEYERRLAAASIDDPGLASSRDDVAMLIYTSGTTGKPKGAELAHRCYVHNCLLSTRDVPAWMHFAPDDVQLVAHPLFHVGAIEQVFRALFNHGAMVLHREFSAEAIVRDTQRHQITIIGLVPTAIQMMIEAPELAGAQMTSLRKIFYGGAPMAQDLLRRARARFGCDFVQSYGMTESGGTVTLLAPDDHLDPDGVRLRSAGREILGFSIRVIDAEGRDVPTGAVGEVAVRGTGVMNGYLDRPEATAEVLIEGGWLRTGDAGWLDAEGYLTICDRVKDMIISGGENVYPAEVEDAIFSHADVAEVAVIGVPDPQWGEAVKAVVVKRPGATADEAELLEWTQQRIARFKVPRSIDFVEALPKNQSGKVLRREIRAAYRH